VLKDVASVNDKTIDFTNLEIRSGDSVQKLTLMEARLLRYLIDHAGRPVSRKEILTELWELHEDTDTRAIDNFIVRLRRLIEDKPEDPRILVTIRGVGYKFAVPNADART
jgi:DNA-binding response OmpR family regulator